MKAGVIGLGAMGAHMAINLHKGGMLAGAWNRTSARTETLAAEYGIPIAASLEDLARRCQLIITSVSDDQSLLETVDRLLPAISPGQIVADTSTVSDRTAVQVAALLGARGAGFLDAPVSGGVEGARTATLAMMVGGDAQVLERAQPALALIARRIVHMGAVGTGQATKAVNQIMAAGINQAVTEALAFGEALGLPMDKVIEVVGSGAAGNWFLSHRGQSMMEQKFSPGFRIALHYKDLLLCKSMAERRGVQLPVVEMTLVHYRRLLEAGFGDEDISALIREKRKA